MGEKRRSNQSILKEINLNVHWKDWCWSWSSKTLTTWCKELTHWKRPWCWERLKAGGKGDNRGRDNWMAWRFNGHELEQTPGDSEGQGSLTCCSPWGRRKSYMTWQLNSNGKNKKLLTLNQPKLWYFDVRFYVTIFLFLIFSFSF